jgi:cytochrome c-type biogenesis protein CcmH
VTTQSTTPANSTEPANTKKQLPVARFVLIGAATIAAIAVGFSIRNTLNEPPQSPTAIAAQMPQGDVNAAIAKLETRLKDNPNDAQGWQMLGWALFQSQKFAEAAQAYARATQIDPKNADYWSSLGEARVLAGPGDVSKDAKTAFEKAVAIDPKDPRARYFLAVAKDIAGDHKGAIDDWLALLADTPAGAPWEADVRRLIAEIGAKEKIDVATRLAALRPAVPTGGSAIATAAIPGPTREQMQTGAQLPKGQQEAMIAGMVDGLEAKLQANPKNEAGWIMLMRSRIQLGEQSKSSQAFKNAKAAFAGDQQATGRLNAAAAELGITD